MKDNSDDYINKKAIQIIEVKNVLLIIAIIIFLAGIYFNKKAIEKILGKKSNINEETSRKMDIGIDIVALIVIFISLYIAYEEYLLSEIKGLDLTASILKIIAWIVAIIPATIFLYIAIKFPEDDEATGIEPII